MQAEVRRYWLVASAVAGRQVRVVAAPNLGRSSTDGHDIFVSAADDDTRVLLAVTAQAALLNAGSLKPEIMSRIAGRPKLARRYLAVEGPRALAEIAEAVPGCRISQMKPDEEVTSRSPEHSLRLALSRRSLPDPHELLGVLRPLRILANERPDATSTRPESPGPDREREAVEPRQVDEEEDTEVSKLLELFSIPFSNPLLTSLLRRFGAGRRTTGGGASAVGLQTGPTAVDPRPGEGTVLAPVPAPLSGGDLECGQGWLLPEWDEDLGRYRPAWCTVVETSPDSDGPIATMPRSSNDLRRRLARLGVGLERRRRQAQGDDVDVDALVERHVDVLAGSRPDEEIYIDSQRRRRSRGVLLLLDLSGSLAEASGAQSAHDQQRRASAMLLDALHQLGDRVALYGFRSYGRTAVHMVRVKGFEETPSGLTYEQLGSLMPSGYTRLGSAVRQSSHILETAAGTDRRLLVVLSDAFPFDDGYEGRYAQSDTRKALSEARRSGIGCVCLTLGASTSAAAIGRVFGTAAHASAARLEDLTNRIGPLFQQGLRSADVQRRLAQRHLELEETS